MARLRIYNPVVFLVIGFLYQVCTLSASEPGKADCLETQKSCPTSAGGHKCIARRQKCDCGKGLEYCGSNEQCLTKVQMAAGGCPPVCSGEDFYCPSKQSCMAARDREQCPKHANKSCSDGQFYCPSKQSCMAARDREQCPKHANKSCSDGQFYCPSKESCMADKDREQCPKHANKSCSDGQFYCPSKQSCMADKAREQCPKHANRSCSEGQFYCPSNESCMAAKDREQCPKPANKSCSDGQFYCPSKQSCMAARDREQCPKHANKSCSDGQFYCPSKQSCMAARDREQCPKHANKSCSDGQFYCPSKESCMADKDREQCPKHANKSCSDGQFYCPSKQSCMADKAREQCPKHANKSCSDGQFYCPSKESCMAARDREQCPKHANKSCSDGQFYCPSKQSCMADKDREQCPKHANKSCSEGQFYCPSKQSCMADKDREQCLKQDKSCSDGQKHCYTSAGHECIAKGQKCKCGDGMKYCESKQYCMEIELMGRGECPPACTKEEWYCQFTNTCIPRAKICKCPPQKRACATKKGCIGKDEECPCPKGQTFCENTWSCLTKSEKCPKCKTGETYCAFIDSCVKDKTTCGCPNGTKYCPYRKTKTGTHCLPHDKDRQSECRCEDSEKRCLPQLKCIPKERDCACPEGTEYCQSNGECVKHGRCPPKECRTGQCGFESRSKKPTSKSDGSPGPKKDDYFFLRSMPAELPDTQNVGYALGYILKSLEFSEATVNTSLNNVGSWEVGQRIGKYRTMRWQDARKVLKISRNDMLRLKPKSIDVHGLDGITLQIGDELKYIGIIVMPCVLPKIRMKINSLNGTEETPMEFNLDDIVNITRKRSSKPNLVGKYKHAIPEKMLTEYKASLNESLGENLGVVVRLSPKVGSIVEKDVGGRGLLKKKAKNINSREPEVKVFYKGSTLVFTPAIDVKDMVKIQFIPVDVPSSIKYLKDVDDKCAIGQVPGILIVDIANVDDRPTVRRDPRQLNAPLLNIKAQPPLPYDLAEGNEGFKISDIARHVCMDKDGDELGIAIVEATKSDVGEWQYLNSSNKWMSIDVTKNKINDEAKIMGERATLLFLTPDRMIRFEPVEKTKLWTRLEAMDHTVCRFVCWDQTNMLKDGEHSVPLKDNKTISELVISATIERYGCDGKASSMKKLNECNECGKKSCKKCDGGGASSTAVLNKCGHCVLGSTGKGKDEGVNCMGGCSDGYVRFTECDNICASKLKKFREDCAGKVCGTSRISRCKLCSDGKDPDKGADKCGVCGGKNKCVGCDGKVKSGKALDLCGKCRSRKSPEFNTGCMRLGKVFPKTFPKGLEQVIEIEGSGLPTEGITCEVQSGATKTKATNIVSGEKSLKLSLPAIETAGEYKINCNIDGTELENNLTIFVYDNEELKVTKVEPADIDIGSNVTEVLVTGNGFMDTGEIFCFFQREGGESPTPTRGKLRQVKTVKLQQNIGERISSTQVKCEVSKVSKAQRVKLSIGLSPNDHAASSVNLTWYAKAPTAIRQSLNYRSKCIFIIFDSAVKKLTKCEDLFDKATITTLKELAEKPKCIFLRPDKLKITLTRDAIIKKDIKIKFKTDAIKSDGAFSYSSTPEITIKAPVKKLMSVAIITAPRKISFSRSAVVSGRNSYNTGGKRFKCTWWIDVDNEDGASTIVKNDLVAIRGILKSTLEFVCAFKLSAENLQPGTKYNVTLQVMNYINEKSRNVTHVIERSQGEQPTLELRTRLSTFDMSKPTFTISVRAKKSKGIKSQVKFLWSCVSDTDLELKNNERNRLILRRDALECDRTYVFNVRAFMATNPKLASSLNVEITTKSATLKAKIIGGDRVVAANGIIKLKTLTRTKGTCGGELIHAYSCVDEDDFDCVVIGSNGTSVFLDLEGETGSSIELKANQFQSKKTYTFTVIVSKEFNEVTDSVKIRIAPGSPPSVRFGTPKTNRKNPIIPARIKTSAAKTEFEWECVDELGYGEVDIYDKRISGRVTGTILKNDKRRFTYKRVTLVFKDGVLEPGVSYKFKLIAYSEQASDDIGEGVVTIKINAPPLEGNLLVTPQEGAAYDTVFSLTASGFYDDDVPLSYKFYYKKGDKRPGQLGDASDKTSVDVELPSGDTNDNNTLTLLVQVKDSFGLITWSSVQVKVTPTEITADVLSKTIEDTKQLLSEGDRFEAVSKISLLLVETKGKMKEGENQELERTLKETKSKIAANFMEENKDARALKSILPLLRDVEPQTEESKKSLSDAVAVSINGQIPASTKRDAEATSRTPGKGKSRRRRRSVEDESSSENEESLEMTTQQLEDTLETFTNLIDTTVINNITKDFLQTVDNLLITMCRNLPVGETSLASSSLAVLKTDKNYMDNVDDTFLDVSCTNCSSMINHTALVKLGSELKDMYNEWNCTGGEELCNGVCLAMVQYPHDLITANEGETRCSDVIYIGLKNPETADYIPVNALTNHTVVRMPLHAGYSEHRQYECTIWNNSNAQWSTEECLNFQVIRQNGTVYVDCNCSRLGFITVNVLPGQGLLGSELSTTPTSNAVSSSSSLSYGGTVGSTTGPNNTGSTNTGSNNTGSNNTGSTNTGPTAEPPRLTASVSFYFDVNYNSIVQDSSTKEVLELAIEKKLAIVMNVDVTMILNVTVSNGSIYVNFIILSPIDDPAIFLNYSISQLEMSVNNGNFVVMPAVGMQITADPKSVQHNYKWLSGVKPDPDPNDIKTTDKDDNGSNLPIILGCVLGVVVLIVIVIAVVLCQRHLASKSKVSDSSQNVRSSHSLKSNCMENEGYQGTEKYNMDTRSSAGSGDVRQSAELPQVEEE